MKLNRRFYDSSINFKIISVGRVVLAVTMGLFSAFIIYSFFYVLRESFRVMSFGFEQLPNILNESERNFYNLFFAGLSIVLGNSITVLYIFSRPNRILSRLNPKGRRILNDQIFLNFNFSYWFTKIGLVFGVFSMCCMDFNFIPYFKPFAYLLLIVLYLESWKNLSSVFKKNRFRLQFTHLIVLLVLTLALSRVNVINYTSIDKMLLKNNPIIDLPQSNFYNDTVGWRDPIIRFKVQLDELNRLAIFTEHKNKIMLNDLERTLKMEKLSLREEQVPYLTVAISANKNLDLKYIKMIESELYVIGQYRIVYDVYNNDIEFSRFDKKGIKKRIPPFVLQYRKFFDKSLLTPSPPLPFIEDYIKFKDTIKIRVGKEIIINGFKASSSTLKSVFKGYINNNTVLEYIYSENTKYQDYITVLSSHFQSVNELREGKQTIFNKYEFRKAYNEEQGKLRDTFPLYIIETLD